MLSAIIVGAGHRAMLYASYARKHPDRLRIAGVADPDPIRREHAISEFGIDHSQVYESAEELAKQPRQADFVINCTMDHQHVPTAVPLLDAGYHVLLEKPFATSEEEMWRLKDAAERNSREVAICHVLRYAPFYSLIKKKVEEGTLGEILNLQLTEHVSYHHMSMGYVRGKWRSEEQCHSGMLMAKSCHDLDIMVWMKSHIRPLHVASFGNNFQFISEKAPSQAGTRCLVDCPIEEDCLYSAKKHFIDHPERWSFYVWDSIEHIDEPSIEDKIESLKTDNPYGRCVWKCDNDVVDHQSVMVEFEDGATATLNMVGGCSRPGRSIHLVGTRGELEGNLESGKFTLRNIDPRPGHEYEEELFDVNKAGDFSGAAGGHGGGDIGVVEDFVRVLSGESASLSWTGLQDSVSGHLLGFRAEKARKERKVIELNYP